MQKEPPQRWVNFASFQNSSFPCPLHPINTRMIMSSHLSSFRHPCKYAVFLLNSADCLAIQQLQYHWRYWKPPIPIRTGSLNLIYCKKNNDFNSSTRKRLCFFSVCYQHLLIFTNGKKGINMKRRILPVSFHYILIKEEIIM